MFMHVLCFFSGVVGWVLRLHPVPNLFFYSFLEIFFPPMDLLILLHFVEVLQVLHNCMVS